jgi:hypothetical protein
MAKERRIKDKNKRAEKRIVFFLCLDIPFHL